MKSVFLHLKWLFYNCITRLLTIFIRRDRKIWLFGAWMGERYADNPRFLFQYLNNNKDKYGIKKVIWVTYQKKIVEELNRNGYECYAMKSFKSRYYHLKAGVHLICNMYDNMNGYPGDIMGRYSTGAKKIQLWHGIGIKSTGKLRQDLKESEGRIKIILKKICSYPIFFPGEWNNCKFIICGEEGRRVTIDDIGIENKQLILANYPRFLKTDFLLKEEKNILEQIRSYKKKGMKAVLYAPTFRKNYDKYIPPLQIAGFVDNIEKNNILWIEKKHLAANNEYGEIKSSNIMYLPSDLETAILLEEMDLVISDYSSLITDAIVKTVVTLNYIPDYEYYKNSDRGFVGDYDMYNPGEHVYDPDKLGDCINKTLENGQDSEHKANTEKSKLTLVEKPDLSYDEIISTIYTEGKI